MPFPSDNVIGKNGERRLQRAMKLMGFESEVIEGKNSAGDIIYAKNKLIEVKTENYGWNKLLQTGDCNLAVEFEQKNLRTGVIKPSGISVTESVFWVFLLGDNICWFHTDELKAYLIEHPEFDRKWSREGTGHNILVPLRTVKQSSIFHWQALPEDDYEPHTNK